MREPVTVALGTEANTLGHQALRGQTGNLVETAEVSLTDVSIAQVVEVRREGRSALVLGLH